MNSQMFGMVLDHLGAFVEWSPLTITPAGITPTPSGQVNVAAFPWLDIGNPFGDTVRHYQIAHGASVFKTVVKRTGAESAVWAPTASTGFILMGVAISVAGSIAAAGPVFVRLLDGSGGTVFYEGVAAVSDTILGDTQMGADFGQGNPSGQANNVLVATFTDNAGAVIDFVTGGATINVWGIEVIS